MKLENRGMISFFLSLLLAWSLSSCSDTSFDEAEWEETVKATSISDLYAPHQDKESGLFYNPWIDIDHSLWEVMNWFFSFSTLETTDEEKTFLPKVNPYAKQDILRVKDRDFMVWLGHNSFLIKTGSQVWLLDPMFSKRALLPARKTPPAITAEDINTLFPNVNVVISHDHYDHLDADSIQALSDTYRFYVPLGVGQFIREWKEKATIVEMDWWDKLKIADGFELHSLPAQHWSNRVLGDPLSTLWASYMIISPKTTLYFGGDSGYFRGYEEFGRLYPNIDYALLPITAYHPRWFMHRSHMNVEEAIKAFDTLGARYFVPTQWGTFSLGDEPAGYPGLDLQREIEQTGRDKSRYLLSDLGELHLL